MINPMVLALAHDLTPKFEAKINALLEGYGDARHRLEEFFEQNKIGLLRIAQGYLELAKQHEELASRFLTAPE